MNSDYIAFESMLAARDAANAAHWSMVATWIYGISALIGSIATLGAVFVAYKTMDSWRSQEDLKERKQLKAALVLYRNTLTKMPEIMMFSNPLRERLSLSLNDAADKIYLHTVVLEEDLNADGLGKDINDFLTMHFDYLQLGETRTDLAKKLSLLLDMKILDLKNK